MARTTKRDREIAIALASSGGKQGRRHHDTMRECATWDPSAAVESFTEVKRRANLASSEVERCYLVNLMQRAGGSVSEGARLAGIDRTNFRRMLQRHNVRAR